MTRLITTAGLAVVIALGAVAGWHLAESRLAMGVYRDRLRQVSHDYEQLRGMYNQAVRRTAVTELLVRDSDLSVIVRTADGQRRTIETPYDPTREIYCDYVLIGGRLWIRRVYDDRTPPSEGTLINHEYADVDWDAPGARYGNAVYRSLGEGRWIITVTGDGSLGLAQADDEAPIDLAAAPEVRDYDQLQQQINRQIEAIGPMDVLRHTFTDNE